MSTCFFLFHLDSLRVSASSLIHVWSCTCLVSSCIGLVLFCVALPCVVVPLVNATPCVLLSCLDLTQVPITYVCFSQLYMQRPRRNVALKTALSNDTPSMNQNKDLQVRGDTNAPDKAAETSKKRVRNPLCNDANEDSGDEDDSSNNDSSDEDTQILPITYPPTINADILWGDETTMDNPLRVGTIIEEGNDTHAYKIQVSRWDNPLPNFARNGFALRSTQQARRF